MTRLKSVAEQAPWELGVAEPEAGRSAPPGPRATPSQAGRKQSEGRVDGRSREQAGCVPLAVLGFDVIRGSGPGSLYGPSRP